MFQHKEADRVPIIDSPWGSTIERWKREGMPADADPARFFGYELTGNIFTDNSPQYPSKVIEETDDYVIATSGWGATLKNWKHKTSVPDFLDFKIVDRNSWAEAKERMKPTPDRVNWKYLEENYPKWQKDGVWICAHGWFGYDPFASWIVGTVRMLMAMVEDPDWVRDILNTALDVQLKLLGMVWDKGYKFDCFVHPDDLGYRNGLFFSPQTFRDVVKPVHKRAYAWMHDRGVFTMMHSCGNILAVVPDLIEIGLDGLNPIETKAGMDLIEIKKLYGDKLVLQGGIDVRKMSKPDEIEDEIRTKVTFAKKNGGYVYHSDHSVPDDVSFENYKRVMELVRKYGAYGEEFTTKSTKANTKGTKKRR